MHRREGANRPPKKAGLESRKKNRDVGTVGSLMTAGAIDPAEVAVPPEKQPPEKQQRNSSLAPCHRSSVDAVFQSMGISSKPKKKLQTEEDNNVRITFPLYVLPSVEEGGSLSYDADLILREFNKAVDLFLGIKGQVERLRPGELSSCFGELKLYLVPNHFLSEPETEMLERELAFTLISGSMSPIIFENPGLRGCFNVLNFESDMTLEYRQIFDKAKERDQHIRKKRPTYSNRLGAEILDFIKLESDFEKAGRMVPALHVVMDTSTEIIDYALFVSSWAWGSAGLLKLQVYVNAYSNDPLYFTLVNKINVLPRDKGHSSYIDPSEIRRYFKTYAKTILDLMRDVGLWDEPTKDSHNMFYREVYLETYRRVEFIKGESGRGAAVDMKKVASYARITKAIVSNKTQSWKDGKMMISSPPMPRVAVSSIDGANSRSITLSLSIVNSIIRKYKTAIAIMQENRESAKLDKERFDQCCCDFAFDLRVIFIVLKYYQLLQYPGQNCIDIDAALVVAQTYEVEIKKTGFKFSPWFPPLAAVTIESEKPPAEESVTASALSIS